MSFRIAISLCTSRRNAWFLLCLIDAEERSEVLEPTCDQYSSSRRLVPERLCIMGSPVDGLQCPKAKHWLRTRPQNPSIRNRDPFS
jgi:hypothetical protein